MKRAICLIGFQRFDEGTICTIQDLAKCCGMPYAMFIDSIIETELNIEVREAG